MKNKELSFEDINLEEDLGLDAEDTNVVDDIIKCVGEQIEIENNKSAILNPERVKSLLMTYQILTRITKGVKTKVTYTMNKPYVSMGVVGVDGKELTFSSPKLFRVAAKLASNFNVYPKANGTVHMDFTFHNLTTPLE